MDEQEGCLRTITVEVPWETVAKQRDAYIAEASKSAKVAGFRKGKAPAAVLNRYFEKKIELLLSEDFAIHHVLMEIAQRDVHLAYGPAIRDCRFSEGKPLAIDATFEVFPRFELGEYENLKVVHEPAEITDEDVEERLELLRRDHASYHNVDPRPIEDGDTVLVQAEMYDREGNAIYEHEKMHVEIDDLLTPFEFNAALRGLEPGAVTDFDVDFPDNMPIPDLAGLSTRCHVTVLQIVRQELPEFDDEFAKDVDDELQTLADLRARVREVMVSTSERMADQATRQTVINQLARTHPMQLPHGYLAEQMRRRYEEMRQGANGSIDPAELDMVPVLMTIQTRAELVLDRIADVEDLTVSPDEIEQQIQAYASSEQITSEAARKQAEDSGLIPAFVTERRRRKAMQLVIDAGKPAELAPEEELDAEATPVEQSSQTNED